MKRSILTLLPLLLFLNLSKAQVIGKVKIECRYKLTSIRDTAKRGEKSVDFMILKIGENVSEFYSYNTYRIDSAIKEERKRRVAGIKTPDVMATLGRKGASYHILKNYPSGKTTVIDRVVKDYFKYEETAGQDWKIEPDKTVINGYSAQKATCTFSGRQYTAWFTADIPVSNGPWKFSGLPGLILKVEDKDGDYKFEMLGLRQIKDDSVIEIAAKPYINTTKDNVQNLTAKYHKHPFAYINENTDMKISGYGTEIANRSIPYNPIELK